MIYGISNNYFHRYQYIHNKRMLSLIYHTCTYLPTYLPTYFMHIYYSGGCRYHILFFFFFKDLEVDPEIRRYKFQKHIQSVDSLLSCIPNPIILVENIYEGWSPPGIAISYERFGSISLHFVLGFFGTFTAFQFFFRFQTLLAWASLKWLFSQNAHLGHSNWNCISFKLEIRFYFMLQKWHYPWWSR
jgi:hypothetical protein